MQDIENLRINQMEELLLGLSENAEKERAELNGESTDGVLEGDDAIRALLGEWRRAIKKHGNKSVPRYLVTQIYQ